MKIVMMRNYAVYFIPRLKHFSNYLKARGHELYVIEESDRHRLYTFAADDKSQLNRILLSQEGYLPYSELKSRIYDKLNKINPDVIITGFVSFPIAAIGLKWAK